MIPAVRPAGHVQPGREWRPLDPPIPPRLLAGPQCCPVNHLGPFWGCLHTAACQSAAAQDRP